MAKVLYIVGDGRSGSTLLNIALGNHRKLVAMGELCNVHRYILGQQNWCSCGQPVGECEFWRAVGSQLAHHDSASVLKLQARYESSPAALRWSHDAKRPSASTAAYQSQLRDVLHSVASVSQSDIIVDASKLPGRAMALAVMRDVELYVVHLVRDARALVWARSKSWKRDLARGVEADVPSRSAMRVCMHWCKANMLASYVRRCVPKQRSIRLRYEDFVTRPRVALTAIGEMLDEDLLSVATKLELGEKLAKGHTASGNRMRMSDVKLRPDFEWRSRLGARSRALTWAIAGAQLLHYGYRRDDVPGELGRTKAA